MKVLHTIHGSNVQASAKRKYMHQHSNFDTERAARAAARKLAKLFHRCESLIIEVRYECRMYCGHLYPFHVYINI
jgi:hypothetical protein